LFSNEKFILFTTSGIHCIFYLKSISLPLEFGVIFVFTFQLDVLSNTFFLTLFCFQPSMDVFKNMLHELAVGRENPDGADQGFLASYFPDLLDQPMFHPPANGTKLQGTYRLPLGYQMDASYYCECL
jgi:hypothetical protein